MNKSEQGKKNRKSGAEFERKVRADLESEGYIISKWMNNIDLDKNKMIPAKHKFNPFMRAMTFGVGFPDFVCINIISSEIKFVECKTNGKLDKTEKEKCAWYADKFGIDVIVASKDEKKIKYKKWND
ncbi:MAG: hypothetical protein WC346_12475 [Methanogenium sp.]|jgi:hypothetical protein